jgi:uncharacterized RDD family membrane protein YckC
MNCPVCKRSLAPTLSICPTCGAMMNDTVREELQTKISTGAAAIRLPRAPELPTIADPPVQRNVTVASPPLGVKTASLAAPKTSPTLVEFQHKSPAVPDWRLQLQNAVQQRKGVQKTSADRQPTSVAAVVPQRPQPLAVESVERELKTADPRVANAMRRIAESRQTFLEPDASKKIKKEHPSMPSARPFCVVNTGFGAAPARTPAIMPVVQKPRLVEQPPALKRDTNKLPRIEISEPVSGALQTPAADPGSGPIERSAIEFNEIKRIQIRADKAIDQGIEWPLNEADEIEDLAPLSMRFGAGLFDFIIGAFAGMVLLSPIAFTSGEWFTIAGLLAFAGTTTIVLFVYMTLCLGFLGKTIGMKLFSLELVDAIENEYPTLRQAAVNSSVFLLSTIFAGAGFITIFFNEERRALHDLLSGTILVREF